MFETIDVSKHVAHYDGSQLVPNYFRSRDSRFKVSSNTIAHWISSTDVSVGFMKDVDDVQQNLSIKSDSMQHFILEVKNVTSPLELVLIQRMFTRCVVEQTYSLIRAYTTQEVHSEIDGNDVYFTYNHQKKKFSVSIAVPYNHYGLIHFAYNLVDTNTPIPVFSLSQLPDLENLENQLRDWILKAFIREYEDCVKDSFKAVC